MSEHEPQLEPDLAGGRATLQAWADAQGLARGDYVETFVKGPVEEPDHGRWETRAGLPDYGVTAPWM